MILFETEGAHNLDATLEAVARAASALKVYKAVVFTAHGDGALALRRQLPEQFSVVAVTFPWQMTAKPADESIYIGMPSRERRAELIANGIQIVQGAMPFRSLGAGEADIFRAVTVAFDTLGGSAKLCVQATLMACDASALDAGERCIVMTSDTAIVARAGHSFNFMRPTSAFAIEQFICKPQYYQITRGPRELRMAEEFHGLTLESTATSEQGEPGVLPGPKDDSQT